MIAEIISTLAAGKVLISTVSRVTCFNHPPKRWIESTPSIQLSCCGTFSYIFFWLPSLSMLCVLVMTPTSWTIMLPKVDGNNLSILVPMMPVSQGREKAILTFWLFFQLMPLLLPFLTFSRQKTYATGIHSVKDAKAQAPSPDCNYFGFFAFFTLGTCFHLFLNFLSHSFWNLFF